MFHLRALASASSNALCNFHPITAQLFVPHQNGLTSTKVFVPGFSYLAPRHPNITSSYSGMRLTLVTPVTIKGRFNSNTVTMSQLGHGHWFIYRLLVHFPPHLSLSSRLSRQRAKMLITPAFSLLSLAFNFGVLLLLHGSDPNFVTTKRNLQRSVRTIESTATEGWGAIAVHYRDIFSSPPTSSASSFPFVDRAEWIYRSCAVRILYSLDGLTSRSPRTSTPTPTPSLSPASFSTSISIPISTAITLYNPHPPACSIYNAPFVVDYAEHPWRTPGIIETNFPRFRSLLLCILASSVICVWCKAAHSSLSFSSNLPPLSQAHYPTNPSDVVEPTYEVHSIHYAMAFMDSDSDSDSALNFNQESVMNSKPQVFTTNADTSSSRSLPVVVTASDGRVLFHAEIALCSNQTISASPSSVNFSVDVVAFRNSPSCGSHLPFPFLKLTYFQQSLKTSALPSSTTVALAPKIPPSFPTAAILIS